MNRRDMLKLACAAPVAVPMAIKATDSTPRYASDGFVRGWSGGVGGESILPLRSAHLTSWRPSAAVNAKIFEADCTQAAAAIMANRENLSVEAQMIEHDLFDFPAAHRSAA